ncbi:hypothetical protein BGX34_008001 [Mortierella sp. NVP85]|nr:hypothetical protein BGX34_008001 [Mortierella sp. NVP85]
MLKQIITDQSKKRIFFICLVFSMVLFFFAVNLQWVPYLKSTVPNNQPKVGDATHKGSTNTSSVPPAPSISGTRNETKEDPIDGQHGQPSLSDEELDQFKDMFLPRPPADGELFLGYLPHSGFHNQLITLENALRLAAYLNRTLLLPPLHLSHKREALAWKEPPVLLRQWAKRNKTTIEYCRDVDASVWHHTTKEEWAAMPKAERKKGQECLFYHSWTITPWTYFYNIPKLLKGVVGVGNQKEPIRVFSRPVMDLNWLSEHLELQDPSKEIYFVNDTARYSYRVADDSETDYSVDPGSEKPINYEEEYPELTPKQIAYMRRYEADVLLTDLQKRTEKVIHFGSLFASDRVDARSKPHKLLKKFISDGMTLWNDDILDATTLAESQIEIWRKETGRVAPGFLGLHFRTEDGEFEKLAPKNLERIVAWLGEMEKLDRRYLETKPVVERQAGEEPVEDGDGDDGDDDDVDDEYTDDPAHTTTTTTPNPSQDVAPEPVNEPGTPPVTPVLAPNNTGEDSLPAFLKKCREAPPESPMIFMATDVHDPRDSPMLQKFLVKYPCTTFLSDFPESMAILDKIRNPVDGVHMVIYMIALMDANLAAKGREFYGTERSTFTAYIINHLWPEYHPGREIPPM